MPNNCVCCGLPVPVGQRICSMCYGDVDYGRDGYYRKMLEGERQRVEDDKLWEEAIMSNDGDDND